MSNEIDFSGFSSRKPLNEILDVPKHVESVYSLTQHVWAGEGDSERTKSRKDNKVRLETLDEFYIDPVRNYLHRILEFVATGTGQGFWIQAEFGVGKSHLLASTAVLAVGGSPAWDKVKQREDEEGKAGPGARIDKTWRKKIESKKLFPIVFSLEGCGGGHDKKLEDFILDEAQALFGLRTEKPLAVYPEEHLATLYLREHSTALKPDLQTFLKDKRLTRGLPSYSYDELMDDLKNPNAQRDAGRVLMAFYRHKQLTPHVPTERGERLRIAFKDILDAGYDGIFIAIDEMSEYLNRSQFMSDDEDCLLAVSSTLAKAEGLPVWTLVAAQSSHQNPKKIIGPDRMREEVLEHKDERFRDIVVHRTRKIKDEAAVDLYQRGFGEVLPWVKTCERDEFMASFPFHPDAINVLRNISKKLTGTRSTISFLHRAVQSAVKNKEKDLVPLWKVFDDLMSYNETPSASSSGSISIKSAFRGDVAALEAAQNTLKRITEGQLARPQNRSRCERILNTLFLYHISGVASLTLDQILDTVCDIKHGEETVEAQRGHYGTLLDEMCSRFRSQIRRREGLFEFVPKETSQYDDLVYDAAEHLKRDPQLLWDLIDKRLIAYSDPSDSRTKSPFADYIRLEDWARQSYTTKDWHGQERTGMVTVADPSHSCLVHKQLESEDDFLIVLCRRQIDNKQLQSILKDADPRIILWSPGTFSDADKATLSAVLAHLQVENDHKGTKTEKEASKQFRKEAPRAFAVLLGVYTRGAARTSRTTLAIDATGGVEGMLGAMATAAMDTCYESRKMDFSPRRFDTSGAVKVINGIVKLGTAVNEGDQLWSAVENFAPILGIAKQDSLRHLDPELSSFYCKIRDNVLKHADTGIEVRTVHNWFTGYDSHDGPESPGLTRRMVDIYLLCMVQKGMIRITIKGAKSIDRGNIAKIDFKPDVLRSLERIGVPRPLEKWQIFAPYLEVMLSKRTGALGAIQPGELGGPIFDRAKADESLRSWWGGYWISANDINRINSELDEFHARIDKENEFTELLVYWLDFAAEPRPQEYDMDEVYNILCRAALKTANVESPEELQPDHCSQFRQRFEELHNLRESFSGTSVDLLRASKLLQATTSMENEKGISAPRKALLKEIEKPVELILNPDRVTTKLRYKIDEFQETYVSIYANALQRLIDVECTLASKALEIQDRDEYDVLKDISHELSEAAAALSSIDSAAGDLPESVLRQNTSRKEIEEKIRALITVQDSRGSDLGYQRVLDLIDEFSASAKTITDAPAECFAGFADFLLSKGVQEGLKTISEKTPGISELRKARKSSGILSAIVPLSPSERKQLAKAIRNSLGNKKAKTVRLSDFQPKTSTVLEQEGIAKVVEEFEQFLSSQWEDGQYLRLE